MIEKKKKFKLGDFDYPLPKKHIAQYPGKKRDESKLMVVNREEKTIEHKKFSNIIDHLRKNDLLILNNTKVFPARLFATKDRTDAKVEVFLLRELAQNLWEVMVRPARKVRIGNKLVFTSKLMCDVIDNTVSGGRVVRFESENQEELHSIIDKIGTSPLPPYITRDPEPSDKKRYQTVYATERGAVAAPTAGLHFDNELLDLIKKMGVKISTINLSVGAGTFQPVKVENINDHEIHKEFIEVSKEVIDIVKETKALGKKVFAVGTTATRAIETAFKEDSNKGYAGYTELFIFPGYKFKVVDRLITNFHLPRSSLLMLVSAFIGYDNMKQLYKIAIDEKYRFLSYGDAMLLKKNEI